VISELRSFKKYERRLRGKDEPRTTAAVSKRMGLIRQRGTSPELRVRRAVAAMGWRYRTANRDLPGSPDLANRTRKWAVFVHGCFWHRHAGCPKATVPKANRNFWLAKFSANRSRDARACEELRSSGFSVATIWECQTLTNSSIQSVLKLLEISYGAA
jgi:DNA mismatch endonuclease (patch repair protein)